MKQNAKNKTRTFRKKGTSKKKKKKKKNEDQLVCCVLCKGFYSKKFFHRHKAECQKSSEQTCLPISVNLFTDRKEESQFDRVLQKLRDDELAFIIKNDKYLKIIGAREYKKMNRREGKQQDTLTTIKADLRRLAALYSRFSMHALDTQYGNILNVSQKKF